MKGFQATGATSSSPKENIQHFKTCNFKLLLWIFFASGSTDPVGSGSETLAYIFGTFLSFCSQMVKFLCTCTCRPLRFYYRYCMSEDPGIIVPRRTVATFALAVGQSFELGVLLAFVNQDLF
jgi:hypothetical protein